MCDSMIQVPMTEEYANQRLVEIFPKEDTNRWNVEVRDDAVYYCAGYHEKHEPCEWLSVPSV